ncbi:MAG TPA: hypothetical protein VFZ14_19480 [Burkholderiales bacterium]|nr:hypothetical protein [Burkholderiales bacterium]
MHSNDDHQAAHELLRAATAVPFTVTAHEVIPGSDEGEFALRLELSFADEESPEEDREDVVEWGALGFLFAVGVFSFADARPRGFSEVEFNPNDEFRLADFVAALKFRNGELHLDSDYVRGRRMKTRAIVRPDGTAMIETRGRGKVALAWMSRLKGDKPVRAVE